MKTYSERDVVVKINGVRVDLMDPIFTWTAPGCVPPEQPRLFDREATSGWRKIGGQS